MRVCVNKMCISMFNNDVTIVMIINTMTLSIDIYLPYLTIALLDVSITCHLDRFQQQRIDGFYLEDSVIEKSTFARNIFFFLIEIESV